MSSYTALQLHGVVVRRQRALPASARSAWHLAPNRKYYLDIILYRYHNKEVAAEIEFTDEFGDWWAGLAENEQTRVRASIELLRQYGVGLPFPHSSGVASSRHTHMRELRAQCEGNPIRVLYAFNPLRNAILLLGGDKTGNDRWYEVHVPIADRLYDEHLKELEKEGLL